MTARPAIGGVPSHRPRTALEPRSDSIHPDRKGPETRSKGSIDEQPETHGMGRSALKRRMKNSYEKSMSKRTPIMETYAATRQDAPPATSTVPTRAVATDMTANASSTGPAGLGRPIVAPDFSITRSMAYNDIRER